MDNLTAKLNEIAEDMTVTDFLEEFAPEVTLGEIVVALYETGRIPEDVLEDLE